MRSGPFSIAFTTPPLKGGIPTITLGLFQALSEAMPDNWMLVLARHHGRYVAGAFNLRGKDTLYGRHWGCIRDFHGLHFKVCYYRTLEYCIEQGLKRFEAGAQGEHKLARGFLPRPTYSMHWLRHGPMRRAVADFLAREHRAVDKYIGQLRAHSPFKLQAVQTLGNAIAVLDTTRAARLSPRRAGAG